MVHIIVPRHEAKTITENPSWSLIYGRRKVGKSFMIENFIPHDVYFSIRLDRSVYCRGFIVSELSDLGTFRDNVVDLLKSGKTVVIDEFQRLPPTVVEDISKVHPKGKLILSGSSMRVSTEIMGKNSPLLGLLRPFRIGLISPSDLLVAMAPSEQGFLESMSKMIPFVVNGLMGEIFREDQRELTQTYASILSLLGQGYTDHREIANILHSRSLIGSSASSSLLPFMKIMHDMGLLEKVKIFGKKREVYRISSFPIELYYHLQAKYGISDREFTFREIEPVVENRLDLALENFLADLFASTMGGRVEYQKSSVMDIDVMITVRNKPKLVAEVKWGKVRSSMVDDFLQKVSSFRCKKLLVTKQAYRTKKIDVMTPSGVVNVAKGKVTL